VTAYELLSGERPWGNGRDALKAIADTFSRDPALLRDVPTAVDAAVRRALARTPADRFPTMDALLAAIAGLTSSPRRRPTPVLLAIAIGMLAVVAVAFLGMRRGGERPAVAAASSASAAPSASASAAHGIAVTDRPMPKSDKPEALIAYREALRAIRAGNDARAQQSLEAAVERDPELAAAWVRLVWLELVADGDARPAFGAASRLRDRLDESDGLLLDAIAPLVELDPPDWLETARRIERLSSGHPDDAELAGDVVLVQRMRLDTEAGVAAAKRAVELDPDYAGAWAHEAELLLWAGRFDESHDVATACFERTKAVGCLDVEGYRQSYLGDRALEGTARRILAIDPTSEVGAKWLASVLLARGEPVEAARVVMMQAAAPGDRDDRRRALIAMLGGDFDAALAALKGAEAGAPKNTRMQSSLASNEMSIDVEVGDRGAAVRAGRAYLAAMPGYSASRAVPVFDSSVILAHELAELGGLPRAEFERRRDAFLSAASPQVGPEGHRMLWGMYAWNTAGAPAQEGKDGVEALARFGEPPYFGSVAGIVGEVRFLAGDMQGALRDLQRGANQLRLAFQPNLIIPIILHYGEALEATGDEAHACDEYARVIKLWGNAKPRSITAEEAKKHVGALKCGG
jgi:tetratricopeptide (TPR) repeat protein